MLMKTVQAFVLALLVAAPSFAQGAAGCDPKAAPANLDFTLKDASGKPVTLADFKGKVVLLNFWATWCVPCRAEIPALVELQAQYRAAGLQVVGVSVDDPPEKMKPFVAQYKINYPALTAFKNEPILETYGPMVVVPWTTIIKRDGTVCTKHIGPASKDAFEKQIKALF